MKRPFFHPDQLPAVPRSHPGRVDLGVMLKLGFHPPSSSTCVPTLVAAPYCTVLWVDARMWLAQVMPTYANTHSEGSACGCQSTRFYHEAREIIADAVNASEEDAVLFGGSGCTGAISKVIHLLGIERNAGRASTLQSTWKPTHPSHHLAASGTDQPDSVAANKLPVVLVGPMEHHSNLLPWRESQCTVIEVPPDASGRADLTVLERLLRVHARAPLLVGSFSAAANVTGILERVHVITALLHRHGALAMWDYACAGPHVKIDMNPPGGAAMAKDAVFLSPHKFPGGPGTPGLLVVKRSLVRDWLPQEPGGGTIHWVNSRGHEYLPTLEEREQGACARDLLF